jgi:hypothetical protein
MDIEELLGKQGVEATSVTLASAIMRMLPNKELAYEFVLQELDGASYGDENARLFVKNSGIDPSEYRGAMNRDESGFEQAHMTMRQIGFSVSDRDTGAKLLLAIVEKVMYAHNLGKYASKQVFNKGATRLVHVVKKLAQHDHGLFSNIYLDLGDLADKINPVSEQLLFMAYAYARRVAAAGLFLQGCWDMEQYKYVSNLFKTIQQQMTDKSFEFQVEAAAQSTELLISYNKNLIKEVTGVMISSVENGKPISAKSAGVFFTAEQIIDTFTEKYSR